MTAHQKVKSPDCQAFAVILIEIPVCVPGDVQLYDGLSLSSEEASWVLDYASRLFAC